MISDDGEGNDSKSRSSCAAPGPFCKKRGRGGGVVGGQYCRFNVPVVFLCSKPR